MDFFPVYLKLTDASCLVVGGGKIAERKIDLLRRAGARVTVVSPTLIPALRIAKNEGQISHQAMLFSADALEGHSLVIAATNQENINRQVALAAKQRNIPVNVVDRPDLCSFIIPSIVDRSPVIIAISTGGASPILARLLKSRLETLIPATYGRLAALDWPGLSEQTCKRDLAMHVTVESSGKTFCKGQRPNLCLPAENPKPTNR